MGLNGFYVKGSNNISDSIFQNGEVIKAFEFYSIWRHDKTYSNGLTITNVANTRPT